MTASSPHMTKTIIALVKWAETPVPTQREGKRRQHTETHQHNPRKRGCPRSALPHWLVVFAITSSPNLSVPPPILRPPPHSPMSKYRLPPGILTPRSHNPDTASSSDALGERRQTPTRTTGDRPPILAPPSRSPLRFMMNEPTCMSIAYSTTGQSIASSNMTDSTYSGLLDGGRIESE